MPERQQPKPQEDEAGRQRRQVDQAADEPRKHDEDELASQGGSVDRTFRNRDVRNLGRRAPSLFAGGQRRAVRQQRLIVQAGVVAHAHVEAKGRMRAHETSTANVDAPDDEIAVLDAGAMHLRVGADARVVPDRDEVPGRRRAPKSSAHPRPTLAAHRGGNKTGISGVPTKPPAIRRAAGAHPRATSADSSCPTRDKRPAYTAR